MKLLKIAALVAAMGAVGAQAADMVVYTDVSGDGIFEAGRAGNGAIPPQFDPFDNASAYWFDASKTLLFTFDQAYTITGMTLSVDNNDFYVVELSQDGIEWDDYHTVLAFQGVVQEWQGGMDTFTPNKPATASAYSFARITAYPGDGSYSVGELKLNGVAAVPEPETLALMLGGIAALGLKLRRRAG